jgi:hypothetical protein
VYFDFVLPAAVPTTERQPSPHALNNALDAAILSFAGERWQKVAKIIYLASDGAADGTDFDAIEARIRALVDDGKLEAKGDLSRWRFSEIRRAQSSK